MEIEQIEPPKNPTEPKKIYIKETGRKFKSPIEVLQNFLNHSSMTELMAIFREYIAQLEEEREKGNITTSLKRSRTETNDKTTDALQTEMYPDPDRDTNKTRRGEPPPTHDQPGRMMRHPSQTEATSTGPSTDPVYCMFHSTPQSRWAEHYRSAATFTPFNLELTEPIPHAGIRVSQHIKPSEKPNIFLSITAHGSVPTNIPEHKSVPTNRRIWTRNKRRIWTRNNKGNIPTIESSLITLEEALEEGLYYDYTRSINEPGNPPLPNKTPPFTEYITKFKEYINNNCILFPTTPFGLINIEISITDTILKMTILFYMLNLYDYRKVNKFELVSFIWRILYSDEFLSYIDSTGKKQIGIVPHNTLTARTSKAHLEFTPLLQKIDNENPVAGLGVGPGLDAELFSNLTENRDVMIAQFIRNEYGLPVLPHYETIYSGTAYSKKDITKLKKVVTEVVHDDPDKAEEIFDNDIEPYLKAIDILYTDLTGEDEAKLKRIICRMSKSMIQGTPLRQSTLISIIMDTFPESRLGIVTIACSGAETDIKSTYHENMERIHMAQSLIRQWSQHYIPSNANRKSPEQQAVQKINEQKAQDFIEGEADLDELSSALELNKDKDLTREHLKNRGEAHSLVNKSQIYASHVTHDMDSDTDTNDKRTPPPKKKKANKTFIRLLDGYETESDVLTETDEDEDEDEEDEDKEDDGVEMGKGIGGKSRRSRPIKKTLHIYRKYHKKNKTVSKKRKHSRKIKKYHK